MVLFFLMFLIMQQLAIFTLRKFWMKTLLLATLPETSKHGDLHFRHPDKDPQKLGMAQLLGAMPSPKGSTKLRGGFQRQFLQICVVCSLPRVRRPGRYLGDSFPQRSQTPCQAEKITADDYLWGITHTLLSCPSCSSSIAPSLCSVLPDSNQTPRG